MIILYQKINELKVADGVQCMCLRSKKPSSINHWTAHTVGLHRLCYSVFGFLFISTLFFFSPSLFQTHRDDYDDTCSLTLCLISISFPPLFLYSSIWTPLSPPHPLPTPNCFISLSLPLKPLALTFVYLSEGRRQCFNSMNLSFCHFCSIEKCWKEMLHNIHTM